MKTITICAEDMLILNSKSLYIGQGVHLFVLFLDMEIRP